MPTKTHHDDELHNNEQQDEQHDSNNNQKTTMSNEVAKYLLSHTHTQTTNRAEDKNLPPKLGKNQKSPHNLAQTFLFTVFTTTNAKAIGKKTPNGSSMKQLFVKSFFFCFSSDILRLKKYFFQYFFFFCQELWAKQLCQDNSKRTCA